MHNRHEGMDLYSRALRASPRRPWQLLRPSMLSIVHPLSWGPGSAPRGYLYRAVAASAKINTASFAPTSPVPPSHLPHPALSRRPSHTLIPPSPLPPPSSFSHPRIILPSSINYFSLAPPSSISTPQSPLSHRHFLSLIPPSPTIPHPCPFPASLPQPAFSNRTSLIRTPSLPYHSGFPQPFSLLPPPSPVPHTSHILRASLSPALSSHLPHQPP